MTDVDIINAKKRITALRQRCKGAHSQFKGSFLHPGMAQPLADLRSAYEALLYLGQGANAKVCSHAAMYVQHPSTDCAARRVEVHRVPGHHRVSRSCRKPQGLWAADTHWYRAYFEQHIIWMRWYFCTLSPQDPGAFLQFLIDATTAYRCIILRMERVYGAQGLVLPPDPNVPERSTAHALQQWPEGVQVPQGPPNSTADVRVVLAKCLVALGDLTRCVVGVTVCCIGVCWHSCLLRVCWCLTTVHGC